MKYLIFSDSHGYVLKMEEIVNREKPDKVLFLGDMSSDAADLRRCCHNYSICSVLGNNDYYMTDDPKQVVLSDSGHGIFLTHGHLYHVKMSTESLVRAALQNNCDIALFGHTHRPYNCRDGGVLLVNPGSITYSRTYATMKIDKNGVDIEIKEY